MTEFLDITAPEHGVEIEIRDDGKVIWIHVDGITALRICQVPLIVMTDHRDQGRSYSESERQEVSSGFWDLGPGHLWRPEEKVDGDQT